MTDFVVADGNRWLWDYVPNSSDEIVFLNTRTRDRYVKWGKLLDYYPKLIGLGWRAIRCTGKQQFDLAVAWEGKSGFPYAMLRQVLRRHQPPLIILAFSIRGPLKHFRFLQRFGVGTVKCFTVPTLHEQLYYSQHLNIPLERIVHCPLGTYDVFTDLPPSTAGDIVFSGGRSGRDYRTFFQAISNLSIPVVVNARPFNLKNTRIPSNVQVNDMLPVGMYRTLNLRARFVVVPLLPVDEAIGLTSILFAMAAGKPVIVSNVPGSSEYVQDGETGLLVPAKDPVAMRQAIEYLWVRPDLCQQMGQRARRIFTEVYSFDAFAQRVYQILHSTVM